MLDRSGHGAKAGDLARKLAGEINRPPVPGDPPVTFAAPLLPQLLGSERPDAGPRSFDRRRTPREETSEVHVRIGRIEVTAVHEAPLPRRPPPRAAKPMSLEEYLARRRGGHR